MRLFRLCVIIIVSLMGYTSANAHEVRPAFLKLTEIEAGQFEASWKQPILSGKRLKLDPTYPEGCEIKETGRNFGKGMLTIVSDVKCPLTDGEIGIAGLERTLTDVFVEIVYLDETVRRELLKPATPALDIATAKGAKTSQYLWIGVEHILFGWDHLLFVLGLVLLVDRRQIIGVATAFTLAHSITLALAAFGLINIPTRPVEILIALSIVLLAIEIIRKYKGSPGLSARRPYLIGFLIGLIHGCGFASALADIGLPTGTELLALLLFNIGVELGQFFVIVLFVIALMVLGKTALNKKRFAEITVTYLIGGIAMFWVIDRMKDYFV